MVTQYFDNTTNVTTFGLQSNDWFLLSALMKGNSEVYDDLATQLKNQQRVVGPPTGSTIMNVTDTYLGVLLRLYYQIETSFGKEVGRPIRNRFKTALEAIQATYPTITLFLTDLATDETADENALQNLGRKWLRGKTGS